MAGKNSLMVQEEQDYNTSGSIVLKKEYKSETPLSNVVDMLEREYNYTEFNDFVFDFSGEKQDINPIYSADSSGEIYPANINLVLDGGIVFDLKQLKEIDPRAMDGLPPEKENYEEPYTVSLKICGERKKVQRTFKHFFNEYHDILKEYSESERIAEERKAENALIDKQNQTKSSSKLDSLEQDLRVEVDGYTWEDIALPENIRDEVENLIEGPIKNPELFEKMGERPQGIALYGKPGVGKTLLAKVISSETDADMYSAKISDLANKYVGQSAQNAENLFKMVKSNTSRDSPSILFFDEADSLFKDRQNQSSHDEYRDMVNTILSHMDGIKDDMENLMVIAATNDVEGMDDASIRPGRFDARIKVPKPNKEARKNIFDIHTHSENPELYAEDIDLEELARYSNEFTGAEIMGAVKHAKMNVMNELKEEYGSIASIPPEELIVDQDTLLDAVDSKRPKVLEGSSKIGFNVEE